MGKIEIAGFMCLMHPIICTCLVIWSSVSSLFFISCAAVLAKNPSVRVSWATFINEMIVAAALVIWWPVVVIYCSYGFIVKDLMPFVDRMWRYYEVRMQAAAPKN